MGNRHRAYFLIVAVCIAVLLFACVEQGVTAPSPLKGPYEDATATAISPASPSVKSHRNPLSTLTANPDWLASVTPYDIPSSLPSSTPTPFAYQGSIPSSGLGSRPPPNPMVGPAWDKLREALQATHAADSFHIDIDSARRSVSPLPLGPTVEISSMTVSGDYEAPDRSRVKSVQATGYSTEETERITVDGFTYSKNLATDQWDITRGTSRNAFQSFDRLSRYEVLVSDLEIVGGESLLEGTPVLHLRGTLTSENEHGDILINTDIWIGLEDGWMVKVRMQHDSILSPEKILPSLPPSEERDALQKLGSVPIRSITSVRFSRYNEPATIEPPVAPPTPSPTPTATPTARDILDLQSSLPDEEVARRILEAAVKSTSQVDSFVMTTYKDRQIGDKIGNPEAELQSAYVYKFISFKSQQTTTSVYRRIPETETLLENDIIRIDRTVYDLNPFTGKWDVQQAAAGGRPSISGILISPLQLETLEGLEILGEELLTDATPVIHIRAQISNSVIGIRCNEGHATLDVWIETKSSIIREEKAFGEQLIYVDLDDSDPFGSSVCPGANNETDEGSLKTITSVYTTSFSDDVERIVIEAPIP